MNTGAIVSFDAHNRSRAHVRRDGSRFGLRPDQSLRRRRTRSSTPAAAVSSVAMAAYAATLLSVLAGAAAIQRAMYTPAVRIEALPGGTAPTWVGW